jgi:hypothetical protein
MGDCFLIRVMVVMTNMMRGKITSHMIDLTWRLYWSTIQGFDPSGRYPATKSDLS